MLTEYWSRKLEHHIQEALGRHKSILLLGPRQTGKTTLLKHQVRAERTISLLRRDRRRSACRIFSETVGYFFAIFRFFIGKIMRVLKLIMLSKKINVFYQ